MTSFYAERQRLGQPLTSRQRCSTKTEMHWRWRWAREVVVNRDFFLSKSTPQKTNMEFENGRKGAFLKKETSFSGSMLIFEGVYSIGCFVTCSQGNMNWRLGKGCFF